MKCTIVVVTKEPCSMLSFCIREYKIQIHNSYLWFWHSMQFIILYLTYRKAIFNWKPEEDSMERQNKSLFTEDSYVPETSIGHLQLVFALMQFGKQRSVDPGDFIATLRINTSLQQDAHVSFQLIYIFFII